MKRYLLFAGDDHYPHGGWSDFKGDFSSIQKALAYKGNSYDWWHVVDTQGGGIVEASEPLIRLWQHEETGRMRWSQYPDPIPGWIPIPTMYEDELPDDITAVQYSAWFAKSAVVDGVRMGPKI